jgi:hypothetical protein
MIMRFVATFAIPGNLFSRLCLQATEDNEMNLIEGEMIEQIEQIDEGWWSGVGDGGAKMGLFPGKCRVVCHWNRTLITFL